MDNIHHQTDRNHNKEARKSGRPRLEDNPLRRYWREQKQKQKDKVSISHIIKNKINMRS
jgi:hypothetical protein